jgi:hypothetical protein
VESVEEESSERRLIDRGSEGVNIEVLTSTVIDNQQPKTISAALQQLKSIEDSTMTDQNERQQSVAMHTPSKSAEPSLSIEPAPPIESSLPMEPALTIDSSLITNFPSLEPAPPIELPPPIDPSLPIEPSLLVKPTLSIDYSDPNSGEQLMDLETETSPTGNAGLPKGELSENMEDIIFYDLTGDSNEVGIPQFADGNSDVSLSKESDSQDSLAKFINSELEDNQLDELMNSRQDETNSVFDINSIQPDFDGIAPDNPDELEIIEPPLNRQAPSTPPSGGESDDDQELMKYL